MILALAILALLGCAALATDLGYFEFSRLKLQNVADAAAIAAEFEIIAHHPENATSAARSDGALNGFANGGAPGTALTLASPPASGAYAGDADVVEVVVTQTVPVFLLRVLHFPSFELTARAVAKPEASPICVISLNRDASGAIQFSGDAPFSSACGIFSDSFATDALSFADDVAITAPALGAAADAPLGSRSRALSGAIPIPDPFGAHPLPAYGGCDHTNYRFPAAGKVVLTAGVFCDGITGPPQSTASLIFRPGLYVIRGGAINAGASVQLRSASTGGDGSGGVTFYLTGDASYPYQGVRISAGAMLTAPRSGPFEGFLFYQDPHAPGASSNSDASSIAGTTPSSYQGILYFPAGTLTYGGAAGAFTVIVADQIRFALLSPTIINADYSSLAHGAPIKTPVLAE